MKELEVKGRMRLLLDAADKCPICATPRKEMIFSWNMFHGEATSDCCGAVYQLKDYSIDNPTDEEQELLDALAGDYFEFTIKPEWIEPLKSAIKEIGIQNIHNDAVIEYAQNIIDG